MSKPKVSEDDVYLVQDLIERCLQTYMRPSEIVNTLFHQADIEPGVTELVFKRLEKENPEFFRLYYMTLIVKDQTIRFNQLLQLQVEIMNKMTQNANASQIHSMKNYLNYQQMPEIPSVNDYQAYQHPMPLENMQHTTNVMPNFYANGESRQQYSMNDDVGIQGDTMLVDMCANMSLTGGSNVGAINGFNGVNSPVMFGADNGVLEPCHGIGETSIPPYIGEISNTSTIEELFAIKDILYSHSPQMTKGFSLPDLTADCNDTDILADIPMSPLLESDESNVNVAAGQEQADISWPQIPSNCSSDCWDDSLF